MISVVVPIYNEEELIMRFHEAVAFAMEGVHMGWEVVYVNDGSTDYSLELLKGLQTMDSHVVVVELSRNWATWALSRRVLRRRARRCDSDGWRFSGSAGSSS